MFRGVKEVFSPTLNTLAGEEPIKHIQDSGFEEPGVKVFSLFREGSEENLEMEEESEIELHRDRDNKPLNFDFPDLSVI